MAYAMLNGQVVGPVEFFTTANMVKGTLLTGQTVVVLNSPYIFSDSALEFYIDEKYWGLKPDTISTEGGKATITFPSAQTEDIEVAVKILGTKEYQTTEAQAIQALSDRVTEIDSNLTQLEDKVDKEKIVYHEDEREVGTWVDGKTIYEKWVHATINNVSYFSLFYDTTIDTLVDSMGCIYNGGGTSSVNSMNNRIVHDKANGNVYFQSTDTITGNDNLHARLRYTKK